MPLDWNDDKPGSFPWNNPATAAPPYVAQEECPTGTPSFDPGFSRQFSPPKAATGFNTSWPEKATGSLARPAPNAGSIRSACVRLGFSPDRRNGQRCPQPCPELLPAIFYNETGLHFRGRMKQRTIASLHSAWIGSSPAGTNLQTPDNVPKPCQPFHSWKNSHAGKKPAVHAYAPALPLETALAKPG